MADRPYLVGYTDRLSAAPGETLTVMAGADSAQAADVALVRMGAGDPTGRAREEIVARLDPVEVVSQRTQLGSFLTVPGAERAWGAGAFTVAVLAMPTRLGRPQGLVAQSSEGCSWMLGLDAGGHPVASTRAGALAVEVRSPYPLVEGAWYLVAACFDPAAGIALSVRVLPETAAWRTARDTTVVPGDASTGAALGIGGLLRAPIVIAAAPTGCGDEAAGDAGPVAACCYDGKLELPQLVEGMLDDDLLGRLTAGELAHDRLLVGWDFADRIAGGRRSGSVVPCTGMAGCDGTLWNTPSDAVTGHRWDGSEHDFRQAPAQYGAIHFHADDLDDCRWRPTIELHLRGDLRSGAYAVRLSDGRGLVDRVPFFIRPARPTAPLVYLVPTASYLAYANDHPVSDGSFSEATAGQVPVLYADDLLLDEHREWGMSCYDAHGDGSGVSITTSRRPLMNMRPTHRYHVGPWQLPADLAVLDWLDDQKIAYDVVTDEDLEREGAELVAPYRAVLTGTHPEYYSTSMLDAVEAHLAGGGRVVYLGANGFYWRVAFDPERPWVMELRRGQAGSRAWESAPGENHLAFTGERGGLWRHLGRFPQRLTGVGYAGQGFDRSGWYRRLPDSYDTRVAFAFDGVDDEVFGTEGAVGGGAVGQEIDRYDHALGTPGDALVLATSEGLTEGYQRCVEEIPFTVAGTSALVDPQVRADVVYHVKPGRGAVFAVGSIAWAGALAVDPAIGRITRNVLDRFCDPTPLPW